MAGMPRVERVCDAEQLAGLGQLWDSWIDQAHPGAVFRSSAWLVPWWTYLRGQHDQLALYVAWRGEQPIGVLPAYRLARAGRPAQLRLLGDGIVASDYLGLIAAPGEEDAAAAMLAREVAARERDMVLEGLDLDDPFVACLASEMRTAGRALASPALGRCPTIAVGRAGSYEDWLAARPQGTGSQVRRRERWLKRQADFRLDILTAEDEIQQALPILWRLHRARWALEHRSGSVDAPAVEAFHAAAARELARRGWARMYVLYAHGAPRAALYGFECGGRFAYYQSGYDPAFERRWVGRVVLASAIEDAFRRHLVEFDFLRGDEEYKSLFASASRMTVTLRGGDGRGARWSWLLQDLVAASRRKLRDALPPRSRRWIRRHDPRSRRLTGRATERVRLPSTDLGAGCD
jgi:CelD/BcsL family acetyltransferase involved in cellulose biosynthesis